MPRIKDEFLQCVIYLYPSEAAAKSSANSGGSGFLISVNSEVQQYWGYVYGVTNAHVINEGATYIRINRKGGGFDVVKKTAKDWKLHPTEDLAICYLEDDLDQSVHDMDLAMPTNYIVDQDYIEKEYIGIGEEVFLTGRFQKSDGKLQNTPTVRWGNLAQMPIEPIKNHLGNECLAYLVECHSISGFSGSPVFTYIDRAISRPKSGTSLIGQFVNARLLGIDTGHLPIEEKQVFYLENGSWEKDPGMKVAANSAMMNVVPAYRLWDLLNLDEYMKKRKAADKKLKKKIEAQGDSVIADSLPDISETDFKNTLKKVSGKKK